MYLSWTITSVTLWQVHNPIQGVGTAPESCVQTIKPKKKKKQETSQWNYSKNCVECWNWWGQRDLSVLFHMSWETTSPCCLKQPRHLGGTMCDFCLFNVNVFISVTLGIWYCCSERVRRLLEFPWKQTKDNVYIQYYSPKCTMCTLEI